jgi:alkylation response protein AidB-like acyl-CoA dehydrogenase
MRPPRCDAGLPYSRHAAVAKLVATDAAMKVTTDAVQVLGATATPRLPCRAIYARSEDHANLRGHQPDSAAGDQPRPRHQMTANIGSRPVQLWHTCSRGSCAITGAAIQPIDIGCRGTEIPGLLQCGTVSHGLKHGSIHLRVQRSTSVPTTATAPWHYRSSRADGDASAIESTWSPERPTTGRRPIDALPTLRTLRSTRSAMSFRGNDAVDKLSGRPRRRFPEH